MPTILAFLHVTNLFLVSKKYGPPDVGHSSIMSTTVLIHSPNEVHVGDLTLLH